MRWRRASSGRAAGRAGSAGRGGRTLSFRPQLFWQEVLPEHAVSSSLQFHCDLASGRWALPTVTAEEVLFGLPKADYAVLDYAVERPPHVESFGGAPAGATRRRAGVPLGRSPGVLLGLLGLLHPGLLGLILRASWAYTARFHPIAASCCS